MVIFHSYVSLPEGTASYNSRCLTKHRWHSEHTESQFHFPLPASVSWNFAAHFTLSHSADHLWHVQRCPGSSLRPEQWWCPRIVYNVDLWWLAMTCVVFQDTKFDEVWSAQAGYATTFAAAARTEACSCKFARQKRVTSEQKIPLWYGKIWIDVCEQSLATFLVSMWLSHLVVRLGAFQESLPSLGPSEPNSPERHAHGCLGCLGQRCSHEMRRSPGEDRRSEKETRWRGRGKFVDEDPDEILDVWWDKFL